MSNNEVIEAINYAFTSSAGPSLPIFRVPSFVDYRRHSPRSISPFLIKNRSKKIKTG